MNFATPFSGLSLIVHLVVIGVAKLARLMRKKGPRAASKPTTTSHRRVNYAFSIGIILVVSSVMLFSFAIALTTSVREAQNDWHMRFVKNEWQALREIDFGVLEYAAEAQERHSFSISN